LSRLYNNLGGNMIQFRTCCVMLAFSMSLAIQSRTFAKDGVIRVGIIGCDTSHVIAFTNLINGPDATGPFADCQVVAAFPGGSPDIPESKNRVDGYVKQLREKSIKIVDNLKELAAETDAILLESVDGRPHLEQFRAVAQGKPIFVDKPAAGSLADLISIYRIADDTRTPVFTSSSLRFTKEIETAVADKSIGEMIGCETSSPMSIESHHPDLFWYGIHGVEPLFTIMGAGCESVSRTDSPLSTLVVGKWKDGRIGSYRGEKKGYYYTFSIFGTKSAVQGKIKGGYDQTVTEICKFFKTGEPPVRREESIEIYAFMEAADESKRHSGNSVSLADVIHRAEQQAVKPVSTSGGK
jgi:predicted dehydrogenase